MGFNPTGMKMRLKLEAASKTLRTCILGPQLSFWKAGSRETFQEKEVGWCTCDVQVYLLYSFNKYSSVPHSVPEGES